MAGRAQLSYFSRPFPLYQIQALDIFSGNEGRGFGGKVMHFIEDMLKKNGKAGMLLDSIEPESPASGMFARRGWVEVPRTKGLYAFNLPKGAHIDELRKFEWRYIDYKEREGRRAGVETSSNPGEE